MARPRRGSACHILRIVASNIHAPCPPSLATSSAAARRHPSAAFSSSVSCHRGARQRPYACARENPSPPGLGRRHCFDDAAPLPLPWCRGSEEGELDEDAGGGREDGDGVETRGRAGPVGLEEAAGGVPELEPDAVMASFMLALPPIVPPPTAFIP